MGGWGERVREEGKWREGWSWLYNACRDVSIFLDWKGEHFGNI
jgi:hypothetical protein